MAQGYGGGLLTDPAGFLSVINILGATVTGSLQFESLGIDNEGRLVVSGNDEMNIGTAIGTLSVVGGGDFVVSGANAVMSFSDTAFAVDGPIQVTDGLLEFIDPGFSLVRLHDNTVVVDGGTLTVAGELRCTGTALTVKNGGSMQIDDDLDLSMGFFASSLTLESTSGAVNVTGALLLDETTVAVSGGTLAGASVDADDSVITVSGGAFDVTGTFATELLSGPSMSVTVSGGDLDMNLFDIGWRSSITVSAGTIDAGSVACATSTVLVSGGTFTVTGVYNTASSTTRPNTITVSAGELELNGGYTGDGVSVGTGFTVSGGTLDVNAAFSNTGSLEFSGGTITVAEDKTATFAELP